MIRIVHVFTSCILLASLTSPLFAMGTDFFAVGFTLSGRYCEFDDGPGTYTYGEYETGAFHRQGFGVDVRLFTDQGFALRLGYKRLRADQGEVIRYRTVYDYDPEYGYDEYLVREDAWELADVQIFEILPGVRTELAPWLVFTAGTGLTSFRTPIVWNYTYMGFLEMELRPVPALGLTVEVQYARPVVMEETMLVSPDTDGTVYLYRDATALTWLGWGYNMGIVIYPGQCI